MVNSETKFLWYLRELASGALEAIRAIALEGASHVVEVRYGRARPAILAGVRVTPIGPWPRGETRPKFTAKAVFRCLNRALALI
jgi:hypothetical protein